MALRIPRLRSIPKSTVIIPVFISCLGASVGAGGSALTGGFHPIMVILMALFSLFYGIPLGLLYHIFDGSWDTLSTRRPKSS